MGNRWVRAMLGLRSAPSGNGGLALTLIGNGWVETMAMGAWMVAWVVTTALLLLVGHAVVSWSRPLKTWVLIIVAAPLAISVIGFILHMTRAALALSQGRKLAVRRHPGGAYARAVALVTTTTPLLLVPQIALGIVFDVLVTSNV